MSSKKDYPKWKAILLGIDILLLILVLGVAAYAVNLFIQVKNESDVTILREQIDQQTHQLTELELQAQWKRADAALVETAARLEQDKLREQHDLLTADHATMTEEFNYLSEQAAILREADQKKEALRAQIAEIRTEYGQACRKLEDMILAGESDYKICYLTFDDGPSYMTHQFLDKIDALDIYVTFFTIGVQMPSRSYPHRDEMLRREALGGHSLANHTHTHGIDTGLYHNLDNFMNAVQKQEDLVYDVTGIRTDVLRFPAGSYYCPFRTSAIAELGEKGYGWIDWVCNAYDSGNKHKTSAYVASTVVWQVNHDKVTCVLMHDWRSETLGALDTIVKELKEDGYLFLPLFKESSLMNAAKPKFD